MLKSLFAEMTDRKDRRAPRGPAVHEDLLDARQVERQLGQLLSTDGVLGCALVETASGELVAGEQRSDEFELDATAAACAQVLRAQIAAERTGAFDAPLDELVLTAGPRQQLMRPLPRGLFLLALVDRDRANLALTRLRMTEAEKNLA